MKLAACQRFHPDTAPDGWTIEPIRNRLWLEYGSSLTDDERRTGEYPVFGSNGQVGTHDTYLVQAPGILVGRKGSVGEIHFSEKPFWPIDTVYYVKRLGEDNWRFLFYMLGYLSLGQLNAATGVPGLTRRDAHFIFGAFPKNGEQTEIATVLKMADEAILAAEAKLTAAKRVKTALMQQLFTRGIPGRHRDFVHTKWFSAPASWSSRQLRQISKIESGFTMGRDLSGHETAEVAYLTVVNVLEGAFDLANIAQVIVKQTELDGLLLRDGDILMTEGGDRDKVGRGGLWHGQIQPCVYQNHIFRVRLAPGTYKPELFHFLLQTWHAKNYFYSHAKQTSNLCTINSREVKRFPLFEPSEDEQDEMIALLSASDDQVRAVEGEIAVLHRLKRSLLQNLLTGKVRVKLPETP
ncbi:MAG: Type-1 restriction enzyme EcoKI specificity protein [Syntrophorhabdus sp. PtaU1.Bin050]|nr:MAG: Type-1 restriction enzyme EcoKI specificity protein [Syntrophorhabdus sp. PtaU1.Bin050]